MPELIHTFEELEQLIQQNYQHPDVELVRRAYALAEQAHAGKIRLTGHPFVTHPLAVAYRLAQMGIHVNVVAAGLLHDIVEDTDVSLDELRVQFGDDIAGLVDSMTKLKKVRYQGEERYVENMRKMFLAMAKDVRVIFMKFSDRIHNLQTLYAQPRHKQIRIARESLEIYAPIASRLGMGEMKGELEDLAFSYLFPKEYERVRGILETNVREKGAYVSHIINLTEKMFDEAHVQFEQVHGRIKRLYSLHKKLTKYDYDLSKVHDLIAVRVIVPSVEQCYSVLGLIHQRWKPLPGRVKDYIAQPKPNGYQSLHTSVFGEKGHVVEFQIRTQAMHDLAEYGVAAHWRYKEGLADQIGSMRWLEELARIQRALADQKDFLEQLEMMKIDLFRDRIFVFTPKGGVLDLPDGATPIDFAYAVHTDIGDTCIAAKVNNIAASLDSVLQSGDIVEIIRDKNRKGPSVDWLKFAKTAHARAKIKDGTKHLKKGWFKQLIRGKGADGQNP